ncbi:MAG: hypothetical protein ACI921_001629 [Polaribacter sp.]|jgi:hypothetical protein
MLLLNVAVDDDDDFDVDFDVNFDPDLDFDFDLDFDNALAFLGIKPAFWS